MIIQHLNIQTIKTQKVLVNDLSLALKKGELLAIMGPSGSGKTTVLDFMAGRIQSTLQYAGESIIQGHIKYISQEDNLHGFYTVRQYLDLYIGLNYGLSLDPETKEKIIKGIAEDCGLTSALNTPVGDVFKKGLSGGQKRRLSIALELIAKPDILILDEPTTGLDSVSALQIMKILKNLTSEGILVICTLHQPSSEIWALLDEVLLLSEGNNCFMGSSKACKLFFSHIGQNVPENYNPADFYLNQINSDYGHDVDTKILSQQFRKWLDEPEDLHSPPKALPMIKQSAVRETILGIKEKANFFTKFVSLIGRGMLNLAKNPGILGVRLSMYIMLSFMCGVMYYNVGNKYNQSDALSRAGLLFFLDNFLVFMSIAVLPFFLIERAIIEKEVANELYHPFHYQLTQFLVSLPGVAVIALTSSLLAVFLAHLSRFGTFFLILWLSLLCAESLARLVSLVIPHYIIGMALIAGIYGMNMLCAGFLIIHDNIPGYFIWGFWQGFQTYSFDAFMYNEFNTIGQFNNGEWTNGMDVLNYYGMGTSQIWRDCVVLIAFTLFFELNIFSVMWMKMKKKSLSIRKVISTFNEA